MPIPQETKDRWLPLLESGDLKQATGSLFNDRVHGYCCLGVYAKACGASFYRETVESDDIDGNESDTQEGDIVVNMPGAGDVNDNELLNQEWADQQGISVEHQKLLSHLNDGGEVALPNGDALYDVYMKHATSQRAADYTVTGQPATIFDLDRKSFAEIARIIKEDL